MSANLHALSENPLEAAGKSVRPVCLSDYVRGLAGAGRRVFPGANSSYWAQYEPGTMVRVPMHCLQPPSARELWRLHWIRLSPLVSFITEPANTAQADSTLYLCRDHAYCLQKLDHAARTNIRRGLRELKIEFLTHEQVLCSGARAFIDNHRKFNPATATAEEFRRQYSGPTGVPGNVFIGAWKDHVLAAFIHVVFVDDWVNISGRCAMDEFLNLRPNETLLYATLAYFLAANRVQVVHAGVNSIDERADAPGLHRFKLKMGFEAVPVHRAFVLHPAIRLLSRMPAQGVVSLIRRLSPASRRMRLAECVLNHAAGSARRQQKAPG